MVVQQATKMVVVVVLSVEWCRGFPVGLVRDGRNTPFRLGLVHRVYVSRHRIGPGSVLEVSADGVHIIRSLRPGDSVAHESGSVFDRWFLVRQTLAPYLPKHIMLTLFRSGLETFSAVADAVGTVLQISGIGPVAQMKIGTAVSRVYFSRCLAQLVETEIFQLPEKIISSGNLQLSFGI